MDGWIHVLMKTDAWGDRAGVPKHKLCVGHKISVVFYVGLCLILNTTPFNALGFTEKGFHGLSYTKK